METNLENMSNKVLRAKCVEYGLPNVPITKTSRKLMERRLAAAMSEKPLSNASIPAKITKVSTKSPSTLIMPDKNTDITIKAPSIDARTTRRTVATMEKSIPITSTANDVTESNVLPGRIILHRPSDKSQPQQVKKTLYPQLPAKETSPQPVQLGKSGVFTTSYMQEPKQHTNAPLNNTYTSAEEIDSNDIHSELSPQKKFEKSFLGSYGNKFIKQPLPLNSIDLVRYRKETSMSKPMTYNYNTKIGTYSVAAPSSLGGYDPKVDSNLISASSCFGGSSFNKISQQLQKPYTSNNNRTYSEEHADYDDGGNSWEEEVFEDDTDYNINNSPLGKGIQTPYLSEFTRNLKNLKTTPLINKSNVSSSINYSSNVPINLRERELNHRHSVYVAPRRTFHNPSSRNFVRRFLWALDEQYHLKQICFIIFSISFAVFLYVFFF